MTRKEAALELAILRTSLLDESGGQQYRLTQALAMAVEHLGGIAPDEDAGHPVKVFVKECCEVAPGAMVECGVLFQGWCAWAAQQGRDRAGTRQVFGRNLVAAYPEVSTTRPRGDGGQQVRMYQGIRLTPTTPPPNGNGPGLGSVPDLGSATP